MSVMVMIMKIVAMAAVVMTMMAVVVMMVILMKMILLMRDNENGNREHTIQIAIKMTVISIISAITTTPALSTSSLIGIVFPSLIQSS